MPIFGPEPWAEQAAQRWSHWDFWFCLVATLDFEGDLRRLADAVYERSSLSGPWERKLSHLDDLAVRLERAGLAATDLGAPAGTTTALRSKARRKVLEQGLAGCDLTEPMRHPPSERLQDRALRGWWGRFPQDPTPYHDRLVRGLLTRIRSGWGSIRVEREVGRRVALALATLGGAVAGEHALRRAVVTVGEELFDHGLHDSDGEFGIYCGQAFAAYAALPWRAVGFEPEVYLRDLCELWTWERYAFTYQREQSVFAGVQPEDMDHVESIFLELSEEYRGYRLHYPADQAMEGLAWASIAARDHSRMPAIASRLGSDHWMPVIAMAKAALAGRHRETAYAIFDAVDVPGGHRDLLRQRGIEMLPERTSRRRLSIVR